MVDEVGVERVVAGDQHRERVLPGAPGAAGLLPQGGAGTGPAADDHGVEAGDVDTQLQRVGGGEPDEFPRPQRLLQRAPLLRQVPGAVGGDPGRQVGRDLGEGALGAERDGLGAAPRPYEGQRLEVLDDEVGEQVGGLGGGGAAHGGVVFAAQLGQRRLPERERRRAARRGVVGDLRDGQAGEPGGGRARVGGGRRGEDEDGLGAVPRAHPPQPAQDLRDVGAEDAAVVVRLVDDDVAQAAQVRRPAGVPGQDRAVQHVGVGQHVVGVLPHPGALVGGRVAVEGRGAQLRELQAAQGLELVGGQGLGRREVEHRAAAEHGLQRGHEIGQRLPGRGAGGDDHGPAVVRELGGPGLVLPRAVDTRQAEPVDDQARHPFRPVGRAARARGDVLHMRDLRTAARIAEEAGQDRGRAPGASGVSARRAAAVAGGEAGVRAYGLRHPFDESGSPCAGFQSGILGTTVAPSFVLPPPRAR